MFFVLLVLFIVVPIAELYVIIQVGQAIGVLPTIGLLLLDSVLGLVLVRTQGRSAWRRFAATVNAGRPPAREALDGALVLLGGALLLAPGFLTDLLAVLLLLPATRALVRRAAARRLLERMVVAFTVGPRDRPRGPDRDRGFDVEGTASDVGPQPRGDPRGLDRP